MQFQQCANFRNVCWLRKFYYEKISGRPFMSAKWDRFSDVTVRKNHITNAQKLEIPYSKYFWPLTVREKRSYSEIL